MELSEYLNDNINSEQRRCFNTQSTYTIPFKLEVWIKLKFISFNHCSHCALSFLHPAFTFTTTFKFIYLFGIESCRCHMFGFHINVDEFWLTFWFMQIEYHLMLETSYSNQYKYYIFIFINAIHSKYLNYSKCHFLDEVWIVK